MGKPLGITDDGERDRNCDHWFITADKNREAIEKAAHRAAKEVKPQMVHNHHSEKTCSPFTKCYTIEITSTIEVRPVGQS